MRVGEGWGGATCRDGRGGSLWRGRVRGLGRRDLDGMENERERATGWINERERKIFFFETKRERTCTWAATVLENLTSGCNHGPTTVNPAVLPAYYCALQGWTQCEWSRFGYKRNYPSIS